MVALTSAQADVLQCVQAGLSNKQIEATLRRPDVAVVVAGLCQIFGVKNRTALMLHGLETEALPDDKATRAAFDLAARANAEQSLLLWALVSVCCAQAPDNFNDLWLALRQRARNLQDAQQVRGEPNTPLVATLLIATASPQVLNARLTNLCIALGIPGHGNDNWLRLLRIGYLATLASIAR